MRQLRVVTTTDNEQIATRIAEIVEAKLRGGAEEKPLPPLRLTQKKVISFYWWKGRVANDEEFHISFDCEENLYHSLKIAEAIANVHNYEIPMILAIDREEGETAAPSSSSPSYWKGSVKGTRKLATEWVQSRLVACAQLGADGSMDVKTTDRAKRERRMESKSIAWSPVVHGNAAYLEWVDDAVRVPMEGGWG